MSWEFFLALVIAIPLITFPAAFVWYINGGAFYRALRGLFSFHSKRQPSPPPDPTHPADKPHGQGAA